jgi:hypothetical protein
MQSRRHLNVRGKSATLPAVTDKDWQDLKFGVDVGVDYYALSFVQARVRGCGVGRGCGGSGPIWGQGCEGDKRLLLHVPPGLTSSPLPSPPPPARPQDARVIYEVKGWLAAQGSKIKVLAKIESADSVKALDDILDAADGGGGGRGTGRGPACFVRPVGARLRSHLHRTR